MLASYRRRLLIVAASLLFGACSSSGPNLVVGDGEVAVQVVFEAEGMGGVGPDIAWPDGRAAIVRQEDATKWWEAVTGVSGLVVEQGSVLGLVGDDQHLVKPATTEETLAAAPAVLIHSDSDGRGELALSVGEYLVCGILDYTGPPVLMNCEDVSISEGATLELYSSDGTVWIRVIS